MRVSDLHRRILASARPPLLLDAFPNAAAAYSLRKLSSSYTGNCIEVRRSSDNALQNIGFVNNVLDTASLLSFIGAETGFIRTWYDQSGNARDYAQTNNANQPRVVISGVLQTDLGKPIIVFRANQSNNLTRSGGFLQMHNHSFFNTAKMQTPTLASKFLFAFRNNFGTGGRIYISYSNTAITYTIGTSPSINIATPSFISDTVLISANSSAGEQNLYVNANFIQSANNNEFETPQNTSIGSLINNANFVSSFGDFLQHELIFYPDGQILNRTAIESNINSFYNIF